MADGQDTNEVGGFFAGAGFHYAHAIQWCAADDPDYVLLLRKRLECFCLAFRPLSETLPICQAIRKATPEALAIWSPPDERGVWLVSNLAQVDQFEAWCRKQVEDGRMNMEAKPDRLIIPVNAVYEDISKVSKPFEPFMWRRDTEGGTDRRIPVEPVLPELGVRPRGKVRGQITVLG